MFIMLIFSLYILGLIATLILRFLFGIVEIGCFVAFLMIGLFIGLIAGLFVVF